MFTPHADRQVGHRGGEWECSQKDEDERVTPNGPFRGLVRGLPLALGLWLVICLAYRMLR